ncbi:hypothetical protein QTP70_033954, partial [Hemibagrus guttatus]
MREMLRDDFRQNPTDVVVAAGEPAILECVPPRGHPEPTTYWKKDKVRIDDKDDRIKIRGGKLMITNTRKSDAGMYVCVGTNMVGERDSETAQVTVFERPTFQRRPINQVVLEEEAVEFRCQVHGDPQPSVRWRKDDVDVARGSFPEHFLDLEKAYDRVPREELWYCMRKSGVAEKYVRVVQDMYERSRTVVRCAVGQTEEFKVEVGLHQGSALSPFLFAIVMGQLSEEVRQESPWTMMFADDIVICSESREQVEEKLERWRFALERRGMKVSRSKTEYMCVNEREGSGTVRLQGEEVKKVQEFKYLGSTVQSNGECGKEERNLEGQMVVDFAKRMDMAVVNTYFQKREEHRVTYKSGAKKKWDMDRTEENRQEYKELQRRVKREVSKAKQKAYDELYTRLDTREGEKDLYRLARQRDRDGKDVQQVRVIKDRDGRVLTSEESVQRRWKEYFEELMNEENEREKRVEGVNSVEQKVDKIRKDEVRKALKRMKSGKAVGPDDIPVEVWKCLGEAAVEFLTSLFNRVLESERMPEEWRRSVLVPIFKNKGDVQSCSNYRGIKLMSHTMKLWERVVEARLRKVVEICEQQYGFMPRKSTTDAIFALRILMEKYRDGQRELHCVFVDLEKVYDRVPREELWYCMRKSGVAEKYVRVVQDMYERSRTVVRCAVGQTEEFKVEVGLHQGSALSPFLFSIVMDQLSEEVRQESPWTMMFADDIVICSESREQVEENLERWRFALERRGMKVSRSKTEYMCVNEREGSGTVRLQGEEVKKVQEFKYLESTVQSNGECGKELSFDTSGSSMLCASQILALPWSESQRYDIRFDKEEHVLRIKKASTTDEGTFTCVAENRVGKVEASGTLTVRAPPQFVIRPRDQIVAQGRTATFPCETKGNPQPAVFWQKEGSQNLLFPNQPQQPNSRFSVSPSGDLTITGVQRADGGYYICQALTVAGSILAKAQLEVTDVLTDRPPPIIRQGPANQTLGVDSVALLKCQASGEPVPTISWLKDGVSLLGKDPRMSLQELGSLQIKNIRLSDSGIYTCVAASSSGETSWSAFLEVKESGGMVLIKNREEGELPGPPSKPQVTDVTKNSVSLSWQPGLAGGSPITSYVIEAFSQSVSNSWQTVADHVKTTQFTVKSLRPNTIYLFMVRAVNSQGLSDPSPMSEPVRTQDISPPAKGVDHRHVQKELGEVIVRLHNPVVLSPTTIQVTWTKRKFTEGERTEHVDRQSQFIQGYRVLYRQVSGLSSPGPWLTQDVKVSSERTIVLPSLKKGIVYEVKVRPYFNEFQGMDSESKTARTTEEPPSAPPQQVTVLPVGNQNSTSISISWDPPPAEHQNGIIQEYRIWCLANETRFHVNKTVDAAIRSVVVGGLQAGLLYRVEVAASTSAGVGVKSEPHPIIIGKDFRDVIVSGDKNNSITEQITDVVKQPAFIAGIGGACWVILMGFSIWLYWRRKKRKGLSNYAGKNRSTKPATLSQRGQIIAKSLVLSFQSFTFTPA